MLWIAFHPWSTGSGSAPFWPLAAVCLRKVKIFFTFLASLKSLTGV
ncbi:hypothetical protein EM595_p0203 (plasmid) [Duffyella gerundensis]|uniref:Uncharacterized protein n=1 Tax=Duffyella gerundensis TaxID=1619313 RepID=A0A0U5L7L3_9GAMM|nr:hypothetical protein EM595_p0203 [Duffyella gerundensis]